MILNPTTQRALIDELTKISQAETDALHQLEKQRSEDTAKVLRTVSSATKPAKHLALLAGEVVPAVRMPVRRGAGVLGMATERAAAKAERAAEYLDTMEPKSAAVSPLEAPAHKVTHPSVTMQRRSIKQEAAVQPSDTTFNQQSALQPGPVPPG